MRCYLLILLSVICFSFFCHRASFAEEMPIIEEITITVSPVFDENNPKENNFLFRLVNKLHIDTKKHVIEKDLTFKKGDRLDMHLLDESERRLRRKRYFSDAVVKLANAATATATATSTEVSENTDVRYEKVNVDVHEVWTLVPKLTYSRAGGNTNYGYGLHDSNFLGLGKTIKVEHSARVERTSDLITYRDFNLGDNNELIASYSDNSDGRAQDFSVNKPFSSVRTPWSAGFAYLDFSQEDTLYNAGKEIERFAHTHTDYAVHYAINLPVSTDEKAQRLSIGVEDVGDEFMFVPEIVNGSSFNLPFDRNYQVVWIEYSHLSNRFVEKSNIQHINRIEDINLGSEWRIRVGSVTSATEPLDKTTQAKVEYTKAFELFESQMLLSQLSSTGFYSENKTTHSITQAQISYHWKNFSRGQFYIFSDQMYGENLFVDKPLELGGDTGLRGYPARFQAGNRLSLLTVEQRYYGVTEWFSLFHLGAAVFYDQGRVWGEASVPQTYQNTLRDVGIGLRISGTRTGGQDQGAQTGF
jgi:outer membrane protein assembly factor BamA